MGTSASENIAIAVTTTSDVTGLKNARTELGALGTTAASLSTNVNAQIGAFEALGKTVDVKSAAAVQAYRAQGDALSANLIRLGATDAEVNRVGTSISKLERAAGASLLDPKSPQSIGLSALPTKARTAASGIGILTQAAVQGSGSLSGMAMAVGNLASGLGSLATSAKALAVANWLAIIIQLSATVGEAFLGFGKKTRELNIELGDLQSKGRGVSEALGGDDLAQKMEQINQAANDEIKKLNEIGILEKAQDKLFTEHALQRIAIGQTIRANQQKDIALAQTQFNNEREARRVEKAEQISGSILSLQLEQDRAKGMKNEFDLQQQQLENEHRLQATEIANSFIRRAANGAIIDLTADEIDQLNSLLLLNDALTKSKEAQLSTEAALFRESARTAQLQGSDNAGDRIAGRLDEIEDEKNAEIRAGIAVTAATVTAEQKKRALFAETAKQANDNAKSIFDVLRSTNDKTLKAVGTFGENLRRVVVGAEAARALVRAAVEGAEAIASLAIGDFRGAALHGAAALEFGSAAALGARESLGGGGGGSSGGAGAGAGGGGGSGTFTPSTASQAAPVVVNLYTQNPYSGDAIQVASYWLNRNGILNRPIWLPPTTGLYGGAA